MDSHASRFGGLLLATCVAMLMLTAAGAEGSETFGSDLSASPAGGNPLRCLNGTPSCTNVFLTGRSGTLGASPIYGVVTRFEIRSLDATTVQLGLAAVDQGGNFPGAAIALSPPVLLQGTGEPERYYVRLPTPRGAYPSLSTFTGTFPRAFGCSASQASYFEYEPALSPGGAPRPATANSTCEMLLNAFVEPDRDCDGLGDETQDEGIGTTGCPKTKITKRPKKHLEGASAKFQFKSNVQGASFECKLDGRRWERCKSPTREHVNRSSHVFQVIAVSGYEADPTPAKVHFTRVG